jgi:hypothetical protein
MHIYIHPNDLGKMKKDGIELWDLNINIYATAFPSCVVEELDEFGRYTRYVDYYLWKQMIDKTNGRTQVEILPSDK